ncbi:MAG: hypothetical protein AVDCRST_MAG38-2363, partial [uncultured Solirubrobacteraceae bacterium]
GVRQALPAGDPGLDRGQPRRAGPGRRAAARRGHRGVGLAQAPAAQPSGRGRRRGRARLPARRRHRRADRPDLPPPL